LSGANNTPKIPPTAAPMPNAIKIRLLFSIKLILIGDEIEYN
jgi:hypothetical protein